MKVVIASSSSCRSFVSEDELAPTVAVAASTEEGAETVPTTTDSNADATRGGTPPDVSAAMTEELSCGASRMEGLEVALTGLTTGAVGVDVC